MLPGAFVRSEGKNYLILSKAVTTSVIFRLAICFSAGRLLIGGDAGAPARFRLLLHLFFLLSDLLANGPFGASFR